MAIVLVSKLTDTWPWWLAFVYVLYRVVTVNNRPTFEASEAPVRNHLLRLKTAVFYVPFVPGIAAFAPFLFQLFLSLMVFVGLCEYNTILRVHLCQLRQGKPLSQKDRERVASQPATSHESLLQFMGLFLNLVVIFYPEFHSVGYLASFWIFVCHRLVTVVLSKKALTHSDFFEVMAGWFGFTWIAYTMAGHGTLIRNHGYYGGSLLGMMILISWFGDAAAFYVGKFLGTTKVFPTISPGKTLEGSCAEVIFCTLLSIGFKLVQLHYPYLHLPPFEVHHYVIIGVASGMLGLLGDMCESYIKRMSHVQDSGVFFPGHGGVLDRFDTFFFIGPFLATYYHVHSQF